METNSPVVIIALMVAATQASRLLPLLLLSKRDISPRFEIWLRHLPIAIMTALIVPDFVDGSPGGPLTVNSRYAVAGVVALLLGLKTKNLVLTTVAGVVCVALLRAYG